MIFRKGTTRFVIAFPKLGFVIKFPIIHFSIIYYTIKNIINGSDWKKVFQRWRVKISNHDSYKYQLLGGLIDNWIEYKLWSKTKHPLLHPTWFSFLGLFNIQKYGKPLKYSETLWLSMILQVTTKQTSHAPGLSHTFGNPENYTGVYGCIRLIDYGNPKLWPVIRRYGKKIMKITIAECGYPPK